jgi:UDP-N-acetylglucosamine--N-acetylmuramyl-(pentapeptide) pyrophosphoryl-undecaprenol N-acetylglucosamine transferase
VTVFAVVAGGGTAGHVLPGIAVAEALVARGHDRSAVRFLGASRGMEAALVPAHGFLLDLDDVRGVPLRPTPANAVGAVRSGAGLLAAAGRTWRRFGRWRPAVVVSVGGYASVGAVLAAVARRVPLVVVSYDAVPGRASRLAARFATASAVAFPSSPLPRARVTGAPVRAELLAVDPDRDRTAAREALGLPPHRFTVVVVGGSLGSGALNRAVDDLLARWQHRSDMAVHHVLGARNDDGARLAVSGADRIAYQPVGYEGRMDLAYAAADVVVARAGATTVAELAAIGVPSVLVPWPEAAEDHQTANARWLADQGGAVVLPETELGRLPAELERLQADPAARAALARAARAAGHRDAADAVARLVEECARS